jgi:hypothetical protein
VPVPSAQQAAGGRTRTHVSHRDDDAPRIQGGFYTNQRATWFGVEHMLVRALDGEFVDSGKEAPHKLEALYITGHSLGGAMAVLAAFRLAHDAVHGYPKSQQL